MSTLPQLLEELKQLEEQNRYSSIINRLPDSVLTQYNSAELYELSAKARVHGREYERAIRDITRAINLEPDNGAYYSERGTHYMYLSDYERAVRDLTKSLKLRPDNVIAYCNRGEALKGLGRKEEALADFNKVLSIDPGFALGYVGRGYLSLQDGHFDAALKDFDKALELEPNNPHALSYKATVLSEKSEIGDALEALNGAIAADPDNSSSAYTDRGEIWLKKGQYDKAMHDFNKAIEISPLSVGGLYGIGDIWFNQGEFQKAVEVYTQIIEMRPFEVMAYNNRAFTWMELKEFDRCIEDFDMSIGLKPDDPVEWLNRGNAKSEKLEADIHNARRPDIEDAIRDYDEAIRLNPEFSDAYCNRAISWMTILEYNKSIKDFEKALELNPADEIAKRRLAEAKLKQSKSTDIQDDDEKEAIREKAASFVEEIRVGLLALYRAAKDSFLFQWEIEEWNGETKEPYVAGIQGWLPAIRPDLAKWVEIDDQLEVHTHQGEEFWPSLVGIPIKKDLWKGIAAERRQYLLEEKQIHNVKNFELINPKLEKIIQRIRTGHLDHYLVFGTYKLPTAMEEFNATLKRMLNNPPKKK